MLLKKGLRGQATIFIIIAVLIIAGISLFFMFRSTLIGVQIPPSLEPVYNTFQTCLEEDAYAGTDILESQGGYIELPEFSPGSAYMPFSSQLDFLGNPIPYWYYVSGNNIQKEQIPSKNDMEEQLETFIEEKIRNCRFDSYYEQGFQISLNLNSEDADVNINKDSIDVSLGSDLSISKNEDSVVVGSHKISIKSEMGALYDSAREIYDYEQENLFLENYGIDTLRLYAPVDGVELTCSPLIWNGNEVFEELKTAIEANTLSIKVESGLLSLDTGDKYFISGISVPHDVRFINSRNWTSGFEVSPSEESTLISSPVGTQPGLGILGFCYVPYHFVYNLRYPVLVQVSGQTETFQFPLAIVIEGNKPREALETNAVAIEIPELCEQKNTLTEVHVFDTQLNSIDADISYECSGTKCDIGKTDSGMLRKEFPQCVNGFVIAKSQGFENGKQMYSVVGNGRTDVFLDKLHGASVQLKLDGKDYNEQATISFVSDRNSRTIAYPGQRSVNLSEGQYEIQVHMFRNSSLSIGATTAEKCIDVPQSGIGGFFGFTKEKCFNIDFPAQVVSSALAGGGKQNYYILESELERGEMEINANSLPLPTTIKQLQENYILFEDRNLGVTFR